MGKPNLRASDREKVEQANILIRWVGDVIVFLFRLGVAGAVENPRGSRLFLCPCIKQAECKSNAHRVNTVYCAFGTAWCKPTTFLYWGWSAVERINRRCIVKHGRCEHSGKPHQVLEGSGPKGVAWTSIASPYPNRLCVEYALAAKIHFQTRFIRKLEHK